MKLFIHENASENVWKMAYILSRPQCVKATRPEQNGCHVVGNIGSGKGVLADNTKPLHGPMLIKFCNVVWFYLAKISLSPLSVDALYLYETQILSQALTTPSKLLLPDKQPNHRIDVAFP